jgi:hypothetical protein
MLVALVGSVWVTREARRRLDGEAQAEREAARRRALDLVQHGASPDPEEGR